jgi:hypothetical protein
MLSLLVGVAFAFWQGSVWSGVWMAALGVLLLLAARLAGATPPVSPEVKRWLEEQQQHRK